MNEQLGPDLQAQKRARIQLIGVALALAAGAIAFRVIVRAELEQTAALFVGVPTLLTIWVALSSPAKTATGAVMRTTTLALLMSGIVLGEGYLCILLSAPLFYMVAYLGAESAEVLRRHRRVRELEDEVAAKRSSKLRALVLAPLLLSSLEGVTPDLSFERREIATAERVVSGTPADVRRALATPLRVGSRLPAPLRIGFPIPLRAEGGGLRVGDERFVHFSEGEGRPPGTLRLVVTEASETHVVFVAVSDTSHITHWLSWRQARVEWREESPGRSHVVWTLEYDRQLDPAWYWRPFGRFFVSYAAEFLIDAAATPPLDA